MRKKRQSPDSFTRLDAIADGMLRKATRGESTLIWLQARWGRIVGEALSRKIQPKSLYGRTLTLSLLDPSWKKPVEATLPELERKLALELPEVRPKITLR
ncbi:MAG: DciA family protein [Acidobacteriota bacterium]